MTVTTARQAGVLNWANGLTVARIAAAPVLFWVILRHEDDLGTSWPGVFIGWTLGFTDYYDGILARRGRVPRWGAFLDPLADKVVVLGGMVSLIAVDRYHWFPVALVAVREVGMTVYRSYWARFGLAIPARRSAKYKTLVQGVAMCIAIMPSFEDNQRVVDGALWIAVALTLWTGYQYWRDGREALSHNGARLGAA